MSAKWAVELAKQLGMNEVGAAVIEQSPFVQKATELANHTLSYKATFPVTKAGQALARELLKLAEEQ